MSTELPMFRFYAQRGEGDCAIAALAMYLGVSYEDALEAATKGTRKAHRKGMYATQIQRAAENLDKPLVVKRNFDFETDAGVLHGVVTMSIFDDAKLVCRKRIGHAVCLRWGLIFEPDGGEVWEYDDYTEQKKAIWSSLLTREVWRA